MAATRQALRSIRDQVFSSTGSTNFSMDGASDRAAIVFIAQETMTATGIMLRLGTITGTTPTYQVAIQGVTTSGVPDGSDISGSTATFSPSSLSWANNTNRWITISGASLTAGTAYAIVLTYSSGTINGSNFASFAMVPTNASHALANLPYHLTDNSVGTYTKVGSNSWPFFGLRKSTSTWGGTLWSSNASLSITTAGHRVAQKFVWPTDYGASLAVRGMTVGAMAHQAAGSYTYAIWNAAGTAIASVVVDTDLSGTTGTGRHFTVFFTSPATLTAGTTYYAGVENTGGTIEPAPRHFGHVDARDLEAYEFGSASCMSQWNGSAWSDTTTSIFGVELHLSDITVASGGGLLYAPVGGGFLQ
jgi:hypothetical protein